MWKSGKKNFMIYVFLIILKIKILLKQYFKRKKFSTCLYKYISTKHYLNILSDDLNKLYHVLEFNNPFECDILPSDYYICLKTNKN